MLGHDCVPHTVVGFTSFPLIGGSLAPVGQGQGGLLLLSTS